MKNKTTITISLIIIFIVCGVVWFYLNQKPPVSYQFKGTIIEVRDTNLAMIGSYVELGQNDPMIGGSKGITVFFDSNTKIIKNIVEIKDGSGFDKPIEPPDREQKTATIAELKADLKKDNLVLTISAKDNIYNLNSFTAASIEYTTLIFK